MPVIVEDGYNLTNSNSYISEDTLQAYADARGYTIVSTDLTELLLKSMDYMETLVYKGEKFTRAQPLVWPRWDVIIDNFLVAVHTMPTQLIQGQCEVALAIDRGLDQLSDIPRIKESVKIGDISVTYNKTMAVTLVRKLNAVMYKILKNGLGSGSFLTGRG